MKKIISLIFLMSGLWAYSQEKFEYTKNGLTDYLVVEMDSLNKEQLYQKTIDWIKDTYVNPDEVIKAKFENEKIRFTGIKSAFTSITLLGKKYFYDARYTIEISFKDGKYKVNPIRLENYSEASKYSAGGWYDIDLSTNKQYFKRNGKIRKVTKNYLTDIPNLFNFLNLELKIYLLKESKIIKDKSDEW